jgi:hypothetical protein
MGLILAFAFYIAIPFVILAILGYKKSLELALATFLIIGTYFWSFFTGIMVTFFFEPADSTYFREYAEKLPRLYASDYLMTIDRTFSLFDASHLIPIFLFDLFRVSFHFIFTHSKITMWIPLLMGAYIISAIIRINYRFFVPRRPKVVFKPTEKHPINVFGRREINLSDENDEVCNFIEKIKRQS